MHPIAVLGLLSVLSAAPREDLERWWSELGSTDGVAAYRAMGQMTVAPETVPFLQERLPPLTGVPRAKISRLIGGLDSEQYAVREKSQRELEKLQDLAEEELGKTLAAGPPLEVRQRIERLLEKMDLLKSPERLRTLRAIEVLEHIGTPAAQEVLLRLAQGAPQAQQTREAKASLARLGKKRSP